MTHSTSEPLPRSAALDLSKISDGYTTAPDLEDEGDRKLDEGTAQETMSKLLNGKTKEWTAIAEKPGPLRLLDLPVDVLKEIVKEVSWELPAVDILCSTDTVLGHAHE